MGLMLAEVVPVTFVSAAPATAVLVALRGTPGKGAGVPAAAAAGACWAGAKGGGFGACLEGTKILNRKNE